MFAVTFRGSTLTHLAFVAADVAPSHACFEALSAGASEPIPARGPFSWSDSNLLLTFLSSPSSLIVANLVS